MEVHTGSVTKPSKSEVLFVPRPCRAQVTSSAPTADVSPIDCGNSRHIPIVDKFQYLGSHAAKDAMDRTDVIERISAANKAFGALRELFFNNRRIAIRAKVAVYRLIIIPIMLYGSECWALTSADYRALNNFHNSCARSILKISLKQQRRNYISSRSILIKLRLPRIEALIARHQLRWAGHVARMDYDRLPRKFLNSWTDNKRPTGSPYKTFARHLRQILSDNGIDSDTWHLLSLNKDEWRRRVKAIY